MQITPPKKMPHKAPSELQEMGLFNVASQIPNTNNSLGIFTNWLKMQTNNNRKKKQR